ncbi:hypothetical protein ACFQU2_02875 [Siccirubricoccus deserti]
MAVFVVAQGLLMYLEPAAVAGLLGRMAERLPGRGWSSTPSRPGCRC